MASENIEATQDRTETSATPPKRQRSSIAFPYMDLSASVAVAKTVHENVGTGVCENDQLAAWMNQSTSSSSFRLRVAASRLFGLLETTGSDGVQLTALGRLVVDPKREREARARAFLCVPLYRAVFDKFKGGTIPPTAALERELASLGVAGTLTDRARSVLERAAEQAGYFDHGRDRLVMPGFAPEDEQDVRDGEEKGSRNGGDGGGDEGPPRHPLITGLFQSLPPDGAPWTIEEAADWLQAAAYNLRFAYKLKGSIKVEITSPRPSSNSEN
jgi:hypothetical protein